jgi:SAM-dependent methyltransferase
MPSSQSDWDEKHRFTAAAQPAEPASIVRELLPLLPHGAALDVACGTGRHALLLGARGQQVTAVDWSGAGLEVLEARARAEGIAIRRISGAEQTVKRHHGGIGLVQADLERLPLPENTFELILCVQYLQRSLFSQLHRALRAGGVLLFETFTQAQLEFNGGPRNPEYLLRPGELRNAFPELRVLFYRELRAGQGIASLMAQKPQSRHGSNIAIQ